MVAVAKGLQVTEPAESICKRIRHAVESFVAVLHSQLRACEDVAKRHGRRAAGAQRVVVTSEGERGTWMSRFAS